MKRLYDKALMDQIARVYGNEQAFLSEFSRALLDIIREGLIRDGQVRLHQFGTFKLKWMNSRNGVNPSTGNKILIQGRPRVIFTPAKRLKEAVEPNPLARVPWNEAEHASLLQPKAVAAKTTADKTPEPAPEPAVLQTKPLAAKRPVLSEAAGLVAKLAEQKKEKFSTEESVDLKAENKTGADPIIAQPESVVADIRDEIEVLEQVAEILKKESAVEPAEKVTVAYSGYHQQTAHEEINETPDVSAFDDKKDKEAVVPPVAKKDFEWNDQSVVDHIKKLSERHYFKNTEQKEKSAPKFAAPEIIVRTETRSALYETTDSKSDQDLDKELNSVSKLNGETDKGGLQANRKPLLAVAAAVIVLLAVATLFNTFTADNQPIDSQAVAEMQTFTAEPVTPAFSVAEEPVAAGREQALIEEELSTLNTVEEDAAAELTAGVIDRPADIETEFAASQLAVNTDALIDEAAVLTQEVADGQTQNNAVQTAFFTARDYRLINGDSLWRLAKKYYVNPFYWPHIYQANQNKINNPDRVKMGKLVLLPTLYGEPDALTKQDKNNIATGYYYNYLYHKKRGNPYAYFSLIGVERFDADLLIKYKEEIARSDIENLSLLSD
ncbi:MAG: HU family DNA-binding protein [Gammaproteobacteria bacterium]|nr:HU family DNA-binding protein [Gammaproteobacteria bacterium]